MILPSYLVEAYLPIRYVRTTYLPDDETCFHLFEARTPAAVEGASRRAALGRGALKR